MQHSVGAAASGALQGIGSLCAWAFAFPSRGPSAGRTHRRGQASTLSSHLQPLHRDPRSLAGLAAPRDLAAEAGRWRGPPPSLTGTWHKDRAASDSMTEACDLVALPWVFRQALGLLNTLKLMDNDAAFQTVLKAGGVMDVVERYPWTGEKVEHGRRDKRRGKARGRVYRPEGGGGAAAVIEVTWADPHGGWCADRFEVTGEAGDTLEQWTEMVMRDGRRCAYRTVYRRVD